MITSTRTENNREAARRLAVCHEATIAYLTCALWSSNDESDESGGEPFDANYSLEDIDATAISVADGLCRAWVDMVGLLPTEGVEIDATPEQIGHDLWLTRNGHGAGFWDRPELYGSQSLADTFSDAARLLGGLDVALGDDGAIYFEG